LFSAYGGPPLGIIKRKIKSGFNTLLLSFPHRTIGQETIKRIKLYLQLTFCGVLTEKDVGFLIHKREGFVNH
jgi:hypothetical protein